MKRPIKILVIVLIFLACIYLAAFLLLTFKGRQLAVKQLKAATQKDVTLGYLGITPPLNFQIKDLYIEGLGKVDSISVSPAIAGLISGKIVFNEIKLVRPQLSYEIIPRRKAQPASDKAASAPAISLPPLILKRLCIKGGSLDLIDHSVTAEGIKIAIKDIDFTLENLYLLPSSAVTNFNLEAKIPWQEEGEEGKIEAKGWLNLFKKDMEATLNITDIDGIYLYPYYSNWVDLKKARIEKAKLNFSSNIQGLDNEITAQCHLELADIVRRPLAEEETEQKAAKITDVVLDIFRSMNQGKIALDFKIKTRMDSPTFGFGDIKSAFEDKLNKGYKASPLQEALAIPAKLLQGAVKGASDLSKAVVESTRAVGEEIKKRAEETFKREPDAGAQAPTSENATLENKTQENTTEEGGKDEKI